MTTVQAPAAPQTTLQARLRLRPCVAADAELLHSIYAATREQELAQWPLSAEQKAEFLRMQSHAQQTHYQAHYARASFCCVELDGQVIGRLYVLRTPGETHLMDISLLPAWRGQGWGTMLMERLLDEARSADVALTAHVAIDNLARHWYARLGFHDTEDLGPYVAIAIRPDQHSPQHGYSVPSGAICPLSQSNTEIPHGRTFSG